MSVQNECHWTTRRNRQLARLVGDFSCQNEYAEWIIINEEVWVCKMSFKRLGTKMTIHSFLQLTTTTHFLNCFLSLKVKWKSVFWVRIMSVCFEYLRAKILKKNKLILITHFVSEFFVKMKNELLFWGYSYSKLTVLVKALILGGIWGTTAKWV